MNEIEELRDALDEAIKRNEALEAALDKAREALTEAKDNLEAPGNIPDKERARMHTRLTAALAEMEPRTDPDHPSWNELIEDA